MHPSEVESLLERHGFPLYIYLGRTISEQISLLKDVFQGFDILYSMKANRNSDVCRSVVKQDLGIDAASKNEVLTARSLGVAPDRILFSAPGKTDQDLRETLGQCVIIADSYGELKKIETLCAELRMTVTAGLRISPNFSYGPGVRPAIHPGLPDKFGEDEENVRAHAPFLRGLRHVRLTGFHVYVRSQVLCADALRQCLEHSVRLARIWVHELGLPLEFINFGGGIGIPYGREIQPPDLERLRAAVARLARSIPEIAAAPVRRYMESGRFLVGKAGIFATRIIDVKRSRGKTFVIAAGLLNNFLRPAIAGLMQALPLEQGYAGPCEPLWSGPDTCIPKAYGRAAPAETVTVCGNLCTGLDMAARDIALENAVPGNLLIFENAGAYAAALSPQDFSGHPHAKEIFWEYALAPAARQDRGHGGKAKSKGDA